MPFKRNPVTGRGTPGMAGENNRAGHTTIPQVKWPPGYKDPPELLNMRDHYLTKWMLEGKPATPFRRALALATARRNYYKPTTFREARRRALSYRMRTNPNCIKASKLNGERLAKLTKARAEARKKVREIEAQGLVVRRQFFNSLSDV